MYGECEPFNIRITLTLAAGSSLRDAWEQNVMEATALFLLLRVHSGAGRLSLLGGESGIGHTITYSHSFSPSLALSSPFFPRSSPTLPLTLSLSPILPPPSTPSKYTYCSTPVTYSSFCYASIQRVFSLNSQNNPVKGRHYYQPHYKDEETEAQRVQGTNSL